MSKRDDDLPPDSTDTGFDADESAMLKSFFRDEAHDYLENITRRLLHASRATLDAAAIAEMLRATHTLKGSAATVGLHEIAEAAHALEDSFAGLRSNPSIWSAAIADVAVEVVDTLRSIVDSDNEHATAGLLMKFREQLGALRKSDEDDGDDDETVEAPVATPVRRPAFDDEDDDETVEVAVAPAIDSGRIPLATPFDADDDLTAEEDRRMWPDRRRDEHQVLRVDAARVDRLMNGVGQLVFDRTRIERRSADLRRLVRDLTKTRQQLRDQLEVARGVSDALAVRVADIEAALAQHIAHLARSTAALIDDAETLRQTTQSLQDGLTQVRMTSVRVLFERLGRSLRTIARAAGKRVELRTSGEDTEFDKTVADQITDPLTQILRNAVAHGIEDAEERRAQGKPVTGHIRLHARHEGEAVYIEVSDDGAGVDPGVLRQRLVDSGRWSRAQAATATDAAILRAIFEPGVSTREETDALAGRGVGLDSVRETIAKLGGDIRLESTRGHGTTFTLRLPITTAISQALLFKIAGNVYAVPNVHVIETAHIEASSPVMPNHLRREGEIVPLVVLQQVLGEPVPADARRVPAVVIEYAGKRLAITCDRVIGPREIVVKSLGPLLAPMPLFAGGTISGSGKVQLILDSAALARIAHPEADTVPASADASSARQKRITTEMPTLSRRVLIADDSRSVRETLGRMLAGRGYIVDTADDGQRAYDMLREMPYDALVTDIEMPRMNGFELLERVRAHKDTMHLPAVVISSRTARANRERARMLGAKTFIPKPVTRKKLMTALELIFSPES